jgi:regulator of protease activity HflC (stomatin/prohibitin superfamily)
MAGAFLRSRYRRPIAIVTLIAVVIAGFVSLIGFFGGLERTNGGEIAVVRNGGMFDNNKIRQVIDPASGVTWIGWWSHVHKYPAQQRFYTITSDAKRATQLGVDVVTVPSSDGVNMGIEGTLYFNVNLDHAAIRRFDDKYGTRKFRGQDDKLRYAYDGDDGWTAFFGQVVRPVIDNDLRTQINNFRCAELISSCALVQNTTGQKTSPTLKVQASNANIAKVQNAINTSLVQDLQQTLGGDFFLNVRFNLVRVTLPDNVQDAVNRAQAAFAQISEAQAQVAKAQAEAAANKARQDGYNKCPTCADIEKLKALPQGITVYAPGNPGGVAVPGK